MTIDRTRWETHYETGNTPWDSRITPPEVVSFWESDRLPHTGLAVDVGCGPGTNVAYLARLGLYAIGTDLAGRALSLAHHRLQQESSTLQSRITLLQSDVTRLPLHHANADYILDIGCFHNLPDELRDVYVRGVIDNLRPGGYYQLYASDCLENLSDDPRRQKQGMRDTEVAERFAPQMQIIEANRAEPNNFPCRWYLLQKK